MSTSKKHNPPLRPPSASAHSKSNDEEIDLVKLRERFDNQLPKYGFLWRSMANARLAQEAEKDASDEGDGEEKASAKDSSIGNAAKDPSGKQRVVGDKENMEPLQHQPAPALPIDTANQKYNAWDSKSKQATKNNQREDGQGIDKEEPTLLNAILNKQPVSLRVPTPNHDLSCGEDCYCADPIIEIDNEDESVYDVDGHDETLVDTDDEGNINPPSGLAAEKDRGVHDVELTDDLVESMQSANASIDDDDESIVCISKTPKKKMFIIDSDEEDSDCETIGSVSDNDVVESDESADVNDSFIVADASVNSNPVHSLSGDDTIENEESVTSSTSDNRRASNRLHNSSTISSCQGSKEDSEEEEWIELSSDEEEEKMPPQRTNNVVILSSDEEEESESNYEHDDHSAFTISDDSSDSDESDASSFRGRRGSTTKTPSLGRPTRRKNDTGTRTTNSHTKRLQSNKTDPRSTLAFRKNRDDITSRAFSEFNQRAFKNALSSVKVTWSKKLNTTAGITRMRGKLGADNAHTRVATIELATKVIDDEERLRSTLLHEMCHAAQWLIDGAHKPPHGKGFKKWAAISMRNIRDVEVTTTHDYVIVYKFAWACVASSCNVVIKRHSRSVDPNKHCCGRCQGKLIEIEVPGSKGDTAKTGHTAKKKRTVSDFALFVKSQSTDVRKSLAMKRSCNDREVSQADVMKECGKLWRARKAGGLENMADRLASMALDSGGSPKKSN